MNPNDLRFPILFEDTNCVVIDKPAGTVVNRALSVKEPTIQDWMDEKYSISNLPVAHELDQEFISRSGMVHRLDKETSGCLLLAKNSEAFHFLKQQFMDRTIKKEYIALVHGKLPKEGVIDAPVDRLPWNREQFGVVAGGKPARTQYNVVNFYSDIKSKNTFYSLAKLHPESGRTHQIRVHMKYLGYPIVGDYLYGGRKQMHKDRQWCPRVFLHAASLRFLPLNLVKPVTVQSDLPQDLTHILKTLMQN